MPPLSLRLWGQKHCHRFGRCVLLDHVVDSGVYCICIDEHGIVACISEADDPLPAEFLAPGKPPEAWPSLRLKRAADGRARWTFDDGSDIDDVGVLAASKAASRPTLSEAGRQAIVAAIYGYYRQHVLEPSVVGFLSILEKQFARSDLYLFELLQNAVDEGAKRVEVQLVSTPAVGLRFTHDGNGFSPLDGSR